MKPHESESRFNPAATGATPPAAARAAAEGGRSDQNSRAEDERLRMLIESAIDFAIFSTDAERRVTFWSSGAERVFGWPAHEMVGRSADIVFIPEDRARGAPQREAATALANGRAEDERWHLRKDGSSFFASGFMFPLRDRDGGVHGYAKIARDLTARKVGEDRLRAGHGELESRVQQRTAELHAANDALRAEIQRREAAEKARQQIVRRIASAQEEERLRLSRELHDEIGQHLAALMLGLNSLEPALRATPSAGNLADLQALTETIGREVHALAAQLRPAALDNLGLQRAITTFIEHWSRRTGIQVALHTARLEAPRLSPEVEITVYRLIQEALTNVMKHASATRVGVIVERQDNELVAVIEDNGRGFEPDAPSARKGLGLLGMNERAAQLGGRVTIESSPGSGTSVFVRLPLS